MTALERTNQLIQEWTQYAIGRPLTLGLARLGTMVAEAIDAAEQAAYERGVRAVVEYQDQELGEQIQYLVHLAGQAGAGGIWLLRGIASPDLLYNLPGVDLPACLSIHNAEMLLIARFPAGDGGEPGVEYHEGAATE